ncbi:MAG: PocR ligand-binding domain-containing protein [Bacteroidetes bacterium]|nr:PocR ligand-binding domain-containing protein [Bacteroidota bacterium]
MSNSATYQDLETRIKILESKIIELQTATDSKAESIWSHIFDSFSDTFILTDSNFSIEKINTKGTEILKKNQGEVFGRSCKELFKDHEANCFICKNKQALETLKQETSIFYSDLLQAFLEINTLPILDEKGSLDKILVHIKDISDLKSQEASVQEDYSKLKSTLQNIPEGIITTDQSGLVLSMNKSASNLCGYSEKFAIGKAVSSVFQLLNTRTNKEEDIFKKVLLNKDQLESFDHYELQSAQGENFLINLRVSLVKPEHGSVEGIILVFSDITNQSLEEETSREHEERLKLMFEHTRSRIIQESEKKLKLRIENANEIELNNDSFGLTDIIDLDSLQQLQDDFAFSNQISSIIVDNDGNHITRGSNFTEVCNVICKQEKGRQLCIFTENPIVSINKGQAAKKNKCIACNLTDQSAPIIVGGKQLGNWLIGTNIKVNTDSNKVKQFAEQIGIDVLELKKAFSKTRILSPSRLEKTVNLLWHLSKEISNLGYNILKLSKDISEQKKFEAQLKMAKEVAEESDRMKTAFLASMSHEIRTPMNAIIGFTDLLSDPDFSQEEKEEFIQLVTNNGDILLRLIDDIIDITKMEAGEFNVDIADCYVNKILKEVIVAGKDTLKRQGKETIELKMELANDDDSFAILTDPTRFRQIITNLLGNSQKFTMNGYIEVGYVIKNNETLFGEDPFLQFYIKDTGIGISEEKREIIFDRFKQADDTVSKKYGGTGLGLTISKKLVDLMGGEIWVESEVGKGSTFYFTLPYRLIQSTKEFIEPTEKIYENIDLTGKTILIVEDIESNFNLLKTLLIKNNAKIIWAKDGKQAVDICRAKNVDLVLMDIKLPVLDGYNATGRIKQITKNIPIIAITAYARENDKIKSIHAGCDDYIPKPIKTELLYSMINKYISKS